MTKTLASRILTKIPPPSTDDACWPWLAGRDRDGYGFVRIGGSDLPTSRAHRAAFEVWIGPIPNGLWVLHRCDNPSCVNPLHLFLGTNVDNMADMARKGRARKSALTPDDVREVRTLRAIGLSMRLIGKKFRVGPGVIGAILSGKTRRYVTDHPEGASHGQNV